MNNIYCYVDESGQDTQGKFFSVSAVIVSTVLLRDEGEQRLLNIERESGKGISKWKRTNYIKRENYLRAITTMVMLKNSLFYSIHLNTRNYIAATVDTIVRAVQRYRTDIGKYRLMIVIDGLNKKERQQIAKQLRKAGVMYKKVRGAKDESSVWIRLADAIAGFSRDTYGNKPYTQNLYSDMQQRGFLVRL